MQSENNHFEEKLSSQSQEITKLKNSEDFLTLKVAQAEALDENTYKMGWENNIAQMQHFFADKDLNFAILNQEEFLGDMLSEGAQKVC